MPMLCCSPDFTHPDPAARESAVERQAAMIHVTRRLGGERAVCRVLSGQRYPGLCASREGLDRVVPCIEASLVVAREANVVLGLENHYKDGFWTYPEFAQKRDVFLALLDAIPDRDHFGVQFDPSNALVAGDDPVELLEAVADRVVSMHASDRYLAEGATPRRPPPGRRDDRLLAQPPPRRHRQGAERLRRDLPDPRRAPLSKAGSASRTA